MEAPYVGSVAEVGLGRMRCRHQGQEGPGAAEGRAGGAWVATVSSPGFEPQISPWLRGGPGHVT